MKLAIAAILILLSPFGISWAEDSAALLTESGEKIVTESGATILTQDGRRINLDAYVKAKGGRVKFDGNGKTAKITFPAHKAIELKKESNSYWIPASPTNGMMDVWQIDVSVKDSIAGANVSLAGSGQSFTTNDKGAGEGPFVVDQIPTTRELKVRPPGETGISTNLRIDSSAVVACKGTKKLKCKRQ